MDIVKVVRGFLKDLSQYFILDRLMNFSKERSDKFDDEVTIIASNSLDYRSLLLVYFFLVSRSELSESEAEYLEKILDLAQSDHKLSLLLNEVDEITYQDLGFFEPESIHAFENERARALEFIVKQADELSGPIYQGVLTDYYELATRSELTDLDAEYLENIWDLAQFDDKLAFLLNQIDEVSYLGLTEKDLAEVEVQKKQALRLLQSIREITHPSEAYQGKYDWLNSIPEFCFQQRLQFRFNIPLHRVIQFSQRTITSPISWLVVVVGTVVSVFAFKCSITKLETHQPISSSTSSPAMSLMSPVESETVLQAKLGENLLLEKGQNLQGDRLFAEIHQLSQQPIRLPDRSYQAQTADLVSTWHELPLAGQGKRSSIAIVSVQPQIQPQVSVSSLEDLDEAEATQVLETLKTQSSAISPPTASPIESPASPEADDPLEVISAPTPIFGVLDLQPLDSITVSMNSSCCKTQETARTQQSDSKSSTDPWSTTSDPLLGTHGVSQENTLYGQLSIDRYSFQLQHPENDTLAHSPDRLTNPEQLRINLRQDSSLQFRSGALEAITY